MFRSRAKTVFLFYKAGPSPDRWSGFVKRSTDGGQTFAEAEIFPAGRLIFPCREDCSDPFLGLEESDYLFDSLGIVILDVQQNGPAVAHGDNVIRVRTRFQRGLDELAINVDAKHDKPKAVI